MPDGTLLHLRDTYPIETAWAPQWVGDELRQVRAGAWHARLAGIRAAADAHAAQRRGHHDQAEQKHALAASYQALHDTYRQRETVFATVMADRTAWEQATRQQRHQAVAADAELRRRHPGQQFPPLRSAEPEPATQAQRGELTLTAEQPAAEMGQWIKDLAAGHRTFAARLADRQSQRILPGSRLRRPRPGVPRLDRPRPGRDPATPQAGDPAVPPDPPARRRPRLRLRGRRMTAPRCILRARR